MKKHVKLLNSNKGFSLLEILISVCVFAIVSVPIISTFTGAAVVSKKTQKQVDSNSLRAAIKESLIRNIKDNVSLTDYSNSGNAPIHNKPGTRPTPTRPPTISGPSTPASTPKEYFKGSTPGSFYTEQYLKDNGISYKLEEKDGIPHFSNFSIPGTNYSFEDICHKYNLFHSCDGYIENVSGPNSSGGSSAGNSNSSHGINPAPASSNVNSNGAAARTDIKLPKNLDPYLPAANKYQRLAIIDLTDKTKTLTEYSFDATLLSDKVNTKRGTVDDKFKAKNTREYRIDVFRELPNGDREGFDSYTVNIYIK